MPEKQQLQRVKPAPLTTLKPSSEAVEKMLVYAGEMYRTEIGDAQITMWKELLSSRRPEHIETAFRAHVKSSPFFPTPADIVSWIEGMEPYFGTPLSNDQQNCKLCGGSGWVEVAKKPGEKNSRVQRCECRMRKQP